MGFEDWLEKTRQKPHHVRTRYMLVTASAVIAVVFVFWVMSVKHELRTAFDQGRAENQLAVASATIESTAPSLFDALKDSINDFLNIFKGAPAREGSQLQDQTAPTDSPKTAPKFLPGTTNTP